MAVWAQSKPSLGLRILIYNRKKLIPYMRGIWWAEADAMLGPRDTDIGRQVPALRETQVLIGSLLEVAWAQR